MNCELGEPCGCERTQHAPELVVLTGGPGAGKTAVLELARRNFCEHIVILPEAASIVFGGGFIRRDSLPARKAAQRAIFRVQRELEQLVIEGAKAAVILCDRGTLDGLAYWPNSEESFWAETGSSKLAELSRYSSIIHLRTPGFEQGYNFQNPIRTESAEQAALIDQKIAMAWVGHPSHQFVGSADNFLTKAARAIELIKSELPECCRNHDVPELQGVR